MSTEPRHGRPAQADRGDTEPVVPESPSEPQVPQHAAPVTEPPHVAPLPPQHGIRRTWLSGLWISLGFFAVVLLLLLIFILQNGHTVEVSYFGFHSHLPLGVALLLSAVCGVLLVGLAGTARILQLRAAARRDRRTDKVS
jgi:uncharacterized integral membrane protein